MRRRNLHNLFRPLLLVAICMAFYGCFGARSGTQAYRQEPAPSYNGGRQLPASTPDASWQVGTVIEGEASWYGEKFHGRQTANGETFDMYALSAAHKDMPLGSRVRITNVENGKQVELTVNDRGPYVGDRILDLSYAAALELGYAGQGTAHVRAEVLELGSGKTGGPPVNGSYGGPATANPYGGSIAVGAYSSRMGAERIYYFLKGRFKYIKVVELQGSLTVLIGPFSSADMRRRAYERLRLEGYDARMID